MESQTGVGGHNTQKNKEKKTRVWQLPKDVTSRYYYCWGLAVAAVSGGLFIHGLVNTPGDSVTEIVGGGIESVRKGAPSFVKHAAKCIWFDAMANSFIRTLDEARGVKDGWNFAGGIAAAAFVQNCHKDLRTSLSSGLCYGAATAVFLSLYPSPRYCRKLP